jgi:diguanylate cyclase (GGDEF)-like protein
VLFVYVDHFKFVNDSLGHGAGDELLREVAGAMRSRLRDDDVLARFGGDEFAVLITDADEAHATAAANHVLTAIRTSVTGVSVTASAGAAVFAAGSRLTASDAIVAADIALYEAKQRGRDRVELYSGQAGQSLTWVEQIRAAIADERLVLHAQPVLDLRGESERPLFELLVRMVGDGGEIIPPSSFLPTAEQFGLIREIDRWVLGQGIAFAAQGNAVSINLSARSLGDPGLPAVIAQLLDETGAQPGHVTLEFTETAAVSSVEDARTFTRSLRELGCAAALDDFGTGFGTFLLLKHLPVSALKIDTEFVRELATSPADQRIVRGIVGLAADAGIRTVAEGVEDAGTLALLRDYGVDYAQGYHIARPAPLGEHGAPARPSRQRDSDALSI